MGNPNLPISGKYNTYIGARYVPLMGGEWNQDKAYEPLVIVTHQGNSYTSNTFVPAGTDINDKTYWTLTGNYNGQVEQYRSEVEGVKQEVQGVKQEITQLNESLGVTNNNLTELENTVNRNAENILETQKALFGRPSSSDFSVCIYSNGFIFPDNSISPYKKTKVYTETYDLSDNITFPAPIEHYDVILMLINNSANPSNINALLNNWISKNLTNKTRLIVTLSPIPNINKDTINDYIALHRKFRQSVNNYYYYSPWGYVYGCVYPNYSYMPNIYNSIANDGGTRTPTQFYYSSYGAVYTPPSGLLGTPNISVRTTPQDYWMKVGSGEINNPSGWQHPENDAMVYVLILGTISQAPYPVSIPTATVECLITLDDNSQNIVTGRIFYDYDNVKLVILDPKSVGKKLTKVYFESFSYPMPVIEGESYDDYSKRLDNYLWG